MTFYSYYQVYHCWVIYFFSVCKRTWTSAPAEQQLRTSLMRRRSNPPRRLRFNKIKRCFQADDAHGLCEKSVYISRTALLTTIFPNKTRPLGAWMLTIAWSTQKGRRWANLERNQSSEFSIWSWTILCNFSSALQLLSLPHKASPGLIPLSSYPLSPLMNLFGDPLCLLLWHPPESSPSRWKTPNLSSPEISSDPRSHHWKYRSSYVCF